MIVSKFGGTSVGSFEAMSRSAQIISDNPNRCWIVISATSGTTNDLLRLSNLPPNTANSEGLMEEIAVYIWTSHRSSAMQKKQFMR